MIKIAKYQQCFSGIKNCKNVMNGDDYQFKINVINGFQCNFCYLLLEFSSSDLIVDGIILNWCRGIFLLCVIDLFLPY